jgi:hypothetical protein
MKTNAEDFKALLRLYNAQNLGRPTRLGVFERQTDIYNDYWLESGLPFGAVEVDRDDKSSVVEIFLDGFTHTVKGARTLKIHFGLDDDEDGIDITDAEGKTTILRFETWEVRS